MQAAKPQYQHFIPQFILRNFNHHSFVPIPLTIAQNARSAIMKTADIRAIEW
jgi:hypothetical protein